MLGANTQQPLDTEQDTQASAAGRAPDYAAETTDAKHHAEWLKLFLKAHAFLRLPAANLHALVARMEEVPVKAGRIIIHQGANANNYYIIREGSCRVVRQLQGSAEPLELAVLSAGDGFGEDALITRGRRNASVVAIEDGCLMRLSRHNFTTLLVKPLLNTISYVQAEALAAADAVLLDVRSPQEHRRSNIKGSINIPLPLLRANLARLDPVMEYVIYCNSGNFSAAGAFLLAQRGLRAHVLAGGLKQISSLSQPQSSGASAATRITGAPAVNKPSNKRSTAAKSPARQPARLTDAAASSPAIRPAAARASQAEPQQKAGDAHGQQTPRNTTIVCIERDDAQLWTPIPVAPEPNELRIIEDTRPATPRNESIRCLETESDLIWAESQMLLSQARSLMGQAETPAPEVPAPAAIETAMATAPSVPAAPPASQVELGWISDAYLWENALGYRHDPAVTRLIGDTAASALILQDMGRDSRAPSSNSAAPAEFVTASLTTSPGASSALAETVEQARLLTAARQRNRQMAMWTTVLLALAAAFWGSQQTGLSLAVPPWLENTLSELTSKVNETVFPGRTHVSPDNSRPAAPAAESTQPPAPATRRKESPVTAPASDKARTPAAPEVALF